MRLGIIRLDRKGLLITRNGIFEPPLFFKHVAEIVMRLEVIRLDRKSLADEVNSYFLLPHLMSNNAKKMDGNRLVRISLQYLSIHTLRFGQTSGAVMLHGEVHGLPGC